MYVDCFLLRANNNNDKMAITDDNKKIINIYI